MSVEYQRDSVVEALSLQNEMILFHPEVNQFYILSQTAAAIWSQLEHPTTSEQIAAEITVQFAEVGTTDAFHDVQGALQLLLDYRLIRRLTD